uniref:Nucleobase-ascorbate transporter 11 n=2 Tax=Anthurium amnicola TaxID=1678845 RepID=A0A1D1Y318_9ARAE
MPMLSLSLSNPRLATCVHSILPNPLLPLFLPPSVELSLSLPTSEMNYRQRNQGNPPASVALGGGSSSRPSPPMEVEDVGDDGRQSKGGRAAQKPGPWPPKIEPFVPKNTDYNPRELKSWARRTGFNPNVSGETSLSSLSEREPDNDRNVEAVTQGARSDLLDRGLVGGRGGNGSLAAALASSKPPDEEREPILGRRRAAARDRGVEIDPVPDPGNGVRRAGDGDDEAEGLAGGIRRAEREKRRTGAEPVVGPKDEGRGVGADPALGSNNGEPRRNGNGDPKVVPADMQVNRKDPGKPEMDDVQIDMVSDSEELEDRIPSGPPPGLKDNPSIPALILYGLQHYLSLAGSLVFIPLIMVPAMGGSDEQTAAVISTMLLVSGVTTVLHSYFGTRLPLVQGSSFVYLAPALVIINSEEFRNLSENKFKHIMRELQGAIIVGSLFQAILGYSGLISLLLRLINPVVVAPTVAAVGLAYFSYGFPQAGNCVEISVPQILLALIFTLYLRKVSILGHRVFLVYAVPLSVAVVWAYAFFLTAGGAYNYKDCSTNVPTSNILLDSCRKHALTMKSCRTDVSNAWRTAAWVRVPYPFQWGMPTFHFKTSFIMVFVSLVASVDSVGSYHATSFLINSSPPTPGIVSRGIGLEGCSSILAGLWGTGTGSTTLTENIHTIDVTKMASCRALAVGAVFLILFSCLGKVGALLASIPLSLAAAVLCFTWALIVALGLSTLQYTRTPSTRNIIIVGFTLFISLSVPSYLQQYQPISNLILPSYFIPYAAASNGPIHLGSNSLNYALNGLLSLNMVVALFVAFVLDNTVPGSKQERGVYIWSKRSGHESDQSLSGYALPHRVGQFFRWVKWVGS